MEDLFPETWRPESLGADAIPCLWVTFFAIFRAKRDLPRLINWQRSICRREAGAIEMRRPTVLHVGIARHFSFPAFDLVFDSVARFGKDGRACVAVADAAGQEKIADLRATLATAQRRVGIFLPRGKCEAHLTPGYGDRCSTERRSIEPFGFRVAAVEYVASEQGKSHHEPLVRWMLT